MNEKNESKIIVKNSLLSVGIKGIDYLLSFLTTPVILACLGEYKYGVYASTLSIISWIYYFDLGIGNGMRNRITEAYTKEDYDSIQKNISVGYFCISIISILFIISAAIVCSFLNLSETLNAPLDDEKLNNIIFIAVVIASINFVFQSSSSVLLAIKKTALNNLFGIVSKMILLGAVILFKYSDIHQLLYVVIAEGIAQLAKNVIATLYLGFTDRRFIFSIKKIDFSFAKGIFGFGIMIFAMQLSALMLNATDNVLIQKLYNSAEVTPYNMCYKYFSIINALFSVAITPFWASYTSAYVQKNIKFIKKTMIKSWVMYGLTFLGIVIAAMIFRPFMKIYLNKELYYPSLLIILMAVYFLILILSHTFSTFVHAISKVKITTIICIISAVINIPLSVVFSVKFNMGVCGIILGSIVCVLLCLLAYMFVTFVEIKKISST